MTLKKLFSVLLLAMSIIFSTYAKSGIFNSEAYDIALNYTDTSYPGDAIFIRMKFSENKKIKKSKEHSLKITASAKLYNGEKSVGTSDFYILNEKKSEKNKVTLLTGIPLSSWLKEGTYTLKINYIFDQDEEMEFELPVELKTKEFITEKIPLDNKNTSIKTDTSPERMKQIEKLNKILATVNPDAVYQTNAFNVPVNSTRYTSFFADRRTYVYTNGKSSTSLHYGKDYGVPTGTEVFSCARGKVVLAETRVSTGYSIVIEHLPGLYSLYYHLSELKVKEGDIVNANDLIGLSGATGLATGPHLHWEMRLNMEAVNPDFFTSDFSFSDSELNIKKTRSTQK